jgi:uncharacterized protein (DUF2236 family)
MFVLRRNRLRFWAAVRLSWRSCRIRMLHGRVSRTLSFASFKYSYTVSSVNEHSYTLDDTKRRFYNTFTNVFAMTFGTLSTAEKASRRVFATHLHVHGTIPQSVGVYRKGDRYSAGDEEAAIWVLATLIDYSLVMYELFVDELSDDEKERHYAFHKRVCGVWGIDAARLPPTFAEFMQYCSQMWHSDRLVVTSDATALADFLLRPLPWERALGINTYAHLTAYLLPTPMVRAYALGGLRSDDKSATLSTSSLSFWLMCAGIGVARVLYRSVPLSVRQFTGAAERAARKNGEPMRWYSRVAARIGTWFVHSVLSAENDSRFKQKIKKQT